MWKIMWKIFSLLLAIVTTLTSIYLLYLPVTDGALTPKVTERVRGRDFEVSIPDPKTESKFCFLPTTSQTRTLEILALDDFEIVQDNRVHRPTRAEDGIYRILLNKNTEGCWTIRRNKEIEAIRFSDYAGEVVFEDTNVEAVYRLPSWKRSFWIFLLWSSTNVILLHIAAIADTVENYSKQG